MKRLTTGLAAIVVFAAACGSGDDADDVLTELGLSDAETTCFETEFDARGLDMDALLTADRNDLSTDELQAVLDISAACVGGTAETAASGDDADETDDADDAATDDASDDQPDDTAATGDDETDDTGDDGAEDADADADDDSDDPARRSYEELSGLEQAFVDGLVGSGGTVEVGICMLDEFEAAGISILELAELGINEADPTPEMLAAIFRCGEELAESGVFDADSLFGGPEGVTYGDNADLDALWDDCAAGDLDACDTLYYTSAIGSDYESFGSTCGETQPSQFGQCANAEAAAGYGDDPALDALWDGCAAGDLAACDTLYYDSPIGSEYESFGSTCGETTTVQYGTCAGSTGSDDAGTDYGDDPALDALWDGCAAGDLAACDDLWFGSPVGSAYEAFAESCGGLSTEELWGTCEATLGG